MNEKKLQFITVGDAQNARKIALHHTPSNKNAPGFMWLGGYNSDMLGTKAERLEQWAQSKGLMTTRHDYSGHGQSGGEFTDGSISRWLEESLCVLHQVTSGPQVLVGSSMGGWIALRMAQELAKTKQSHKIAALLLLAPAPDFTQTLMVPKFSSEDHANMAAKGYIEQPTPYADTPNIITKKLIDDGQENAVLNAPIKPHCPVHIIQGMNDPDVPYPHALKLIDQLPLENVTATFIKDGDHRLSRESDIACILRICEDIHKNTIS